MSQILISCREAAIATIPLLPLFCLLNHHRIRNWKRSAVYLVFSIYLSTMYAAVGLPDITYYRFHPHFNFVPFLYMFTAWETTVLNVLLFVPLGFFMPVLWNDYKSWFKTLFLGFGISSMIEVLQIFTYRATDINDLMTNTLGTFVGFLIGRLFLKCCPSFHSMNDNRDIGLVFGISFAVMFFIYPFVSALLR